MEKIKKYFLPSILFLILILPMFFGVYLEFLYFRKLNFAIFFLLIIGVIFFLIIGKLIERYGYNYQNIKIFRKHDVINALISKKNKVILWLFFPMIMIIEELIFRYYLVGFLVVTLKSEIILSLFVSSLIFSLFHIHTWFSYKSIRILLINLSFSFLLGLFNGYILLNLGIVPCMIIHYGVVMILYYNIYRRYFKIS